MRVETTRGQKINAWILTCALGLVALAFNVTAATSRAGYHSRQGPFSIYLLVVTALCALLAIRYASAFTECAPDRIRTRRIFGSRSCPWTEVAEITVYGGRVPFASVMRTNGTRFRLGAPSSRFVSRMHFNAQGARILAYWKETSASTGAKNPTR